MTLKQSIKNHPVLFTILFILILALIVAAAIIIYRISNAGYGIESPQIPWKCDIDYYNCGDFDLQSKAQTVFDVCGGSDNDIHQLDNDGDGVVCESLP